jgi:hypothetical protein
MSSPETPRNYIRFTYRTLLDVVIAEVHWSLETEADILDWYDEYRRYFETRFPGRKCDVIFELTEFRVTAKVAARFSEVRTQLVEHYTRLSYRVNIHDIARTAMYTSSVLRGAPANEYRTVDEAIEVLQADRTRLSGGSAGPSQPT